jgi:phosphate starvation-inducible protein PhoH
LAVLIEIVHDREIEGVEIIEFTLDDIVRSNLCAAFVRAFHERGL